MLILLFCRIFYNSPSPPCCCLPFLFTILSYSSIYLTYLYTTERESIFFLPPPFAKSYYHSLLFYLLFLIFSYYSCLFPSFIALPSSSSPFFLLPLSFIIIFFSSPLYDASYFSSCVRFFSFILFLSTCYLEFLLPLFY